VTDAEARRPAPTGGKPPARRKEQARQWLGFAGGVLVTLFAVLNLDEVKVNWIVGSRQTPLIVVIVLSLLVGLGLGYLFARRRPSRRR
jgi:uncharacterized integral membrane protein